MAWTVTTPPASEPLTLEETKLHLRVEHSADDTLINTLIQAAREVAEDLTWRAVVTQTITLVLDGFPSDGIIELPRPPLIQVDSVQYVDTNGETQTLTADSDYQVDAYSEPARIVPAYNQTWPSTRPIANAVTVVYQAGYGAAADVPRKIRQAMLLIVGEWYTHREEYAGKPVREAVPLRARDLLRSLWIR